SDGAGGSPGDLGGEGIVPVVPSAEGVAATGRTRDPAADALLSEILPAPATADASQQALPGLQTTRLGVLPGSGSGGGAGSGGGWAGARVGERGEASARGWVQGPSSLEPASTLGPSRMSSTAQGAWPRATRWGWRNASWWPV